MSCPSINFQFIPVAYVLMMSKTLENYANVITEIRRLYPNWTIHKFMSDYEPAIQSAVRQAFPTCHLIGCWFHFAQVRKFALLC